jgi:hypothetical protein
VRSWFGEAGMNVRGFAFVKPRQMMADGENLTLVERFLKR